MFIMSACLATKWAFKCIFLSKCIYHTPTNATTAFEVMGNKTLHAQELLGKAMVSKTTCRILTAH